MMSVHLTGNMNARAAHFHAHASALVFVTTDRWETYDMDARASPRNPYVCNFSKSEKFEILDVVNRSARMGRSSFCVIVRNRD